MKAIVQDRYGPPDVLQLTEIERPTPGDDDVLVHVRAASVNPQDWHIMRAAPFIVRTSGYGLRTPTKPIRGTDVAGDVESVGRNVTRFTPGDVLGWCEGSFAEYVAADQSHFVTKPAALSFEAAGAISMAGCTAIQGLRDAGAVQPGQEVHVVDYTREDFTRSGKRYDVIFQLAGTASPSACRRALTPKGTLVLSSGEGRFAGIDRILRAMVSAPFVRQRQRLLRTKETSDDLVAVVELIEAGSLTPVIDKTYPLSEVPEAVRYIEAGNARGKVIITV